MAEITTARNVECMQSISFEIVYTPSIKRTSISYQNKDEKTETISGHDMFSIYRITFHPCSGRSAT
jgi:mannose/fructose/N-acetylgalactosamine-specific phosphotransferase system component IID